MLSSMCGTAPSQVRISAVASASPGHLFERAVRLETATFPGDHSGSSTITTSAGGFTRVVRVRVKAENAELISRGFLAPSRCQVVRSYEASAVSPVAANATASQGSLVSGAAAVGGQFGGEQPSLAPREEIYENEYEAREAVLTYLKSQAIETVELESVTLPPSVTVMEERITFLKKIGLSTKDINYYPLMLGCSVKKNLVPVLSYLEKLNVEAKFLPDLIRKYPMVLNSSVTMDLEPVVTFLLGIGIDRLNLGRVLTRYPDILGFKIEGTMSTSIAYLVSLGVNMREIGPMITECPEILGMRVGNNIKLKVEYLLGLGIPKEVLAKVLEVKPFVLSFDLEEKMKPAIEELRSLGVREEHLSRVVIQYADILGLNVKHRLETKMGWLMKHAGVKREDVGRVMEKLPQILAINIALAQSRVTFLSREGFSVEDLGTMVTKCPQLLALSIDEVLRPHLSFFVESMKRPLSELVDYPFYFTYNLEKRVRPRYIQLEQKGVQCSLSWFLNCSDAKFSDRLQLDMVERPDLDETEEPLVSLGGRIKIKGEDLSNEISNEEPNIGDRVRIRGQGGRNEVLDEENKLAAES
ncbi:unnamed protein product [Calypogeia fissa]